MENIHTQYSRKILNPILNAHCRAMSMFFLSNTLPITTLPKFSTLTPSISSNFMTDYLTTSLGLSPQQAATASKPISHIASSSKPDSVRHFLKHNAGFSDEQIQSIIIRYPRILCCNICKRMEPNLRQLIDTAFFPDLDELRNFVVTNPLILQRASAITRFEFWAKFFDGDVERLKLVFKRNNTLISLKIDTVVAPKIALLKEYGLSDDTLLTIFTRTRFLQTSLASNESTLKRVEEFGFSHGSPMFAHAVLSLYGINADTLKVKMELYKSFGWSDKEVLSAVMKFPFIICLSEENIRAKMRFFLQKAACTPEYIAANPVLLGFSLEKRLKPRHQVMEILKSNELFRKNLNWCTIMAYSEKKFAARFVLPYKTILPKLFEVYNIAHDGKLPVNLDT